MASKAKSNLVRISRIHGGHVLGLEESTLDLDLVTVIEGKNATGKSSHLALARSVLGIDRTSLAKLARVNGSGDEEPFGEVLLIGQDWEARVTKRGDQTQRVAERVGEDWREIRRPVEWLRDLIDQGANPAVWLAMDDEAKTTAVLEAMRIEGYTREAALKAAGLEGFSLPPIPRGLHPLEELEQIEAAVFSCRTEVNNQRRTKHEAAQSLLAGLPAEPPTDLADQVARLETSASSMSGEVARAEAAASSAEREAIAAADGAYEIAEANALGTFRATAAKLRTAHEARVAEIQAEAERKIAAALAETQSRIDALRAQGEGARDAAREAAEAAKAAARKALEDARAASEGKRAELAKVTEHLAGLRAQQQAIATDRHVRAAAAKDEAEARQHEARAAALTKALEALTRYKLELAAQLPIKGLAVKFDEKGRKSLTLDRVPLGQVNKARLAELAVEVSLLRQPKDDGRPHLPLVLLDDAEKLDPEARIALFRECAARGTQIIAAVVGPNAPLRILRGEEALGGEAA